MQTTTYGEACTVAICAVLLFLYSVYTYAVWSVYRQRTAVCRAIAVTPFRNITSAIFLKNPKSAFQYSLNGNGGIFSY